MTVIDWSKFKEDIVKHNEGTQMRLPFKEDLVNSPKHYTSGKIEVIDYIEDQKLNYHLGNVIKYISRAGKKGSVLEDLKKAQWYLNRYIDALEN